DEEELVSLFAEDALAGDFAQADLRPAQVGENRDRLVEVAAHLANPIDEHLLLLGPAVGHVQPENVGPCEDQLGQHVDLAARRADGGDDLGAGPLSAGSRQGISVHDSFATDRSRQAGWWGKVRGPVLWPLDASMGI